MSSKGREDEILTRVISYIALHPLCNTYEMEKYGGLKRRIQAMRKIKQYRLEEEGYIKVGEAPRNAKLLSLTFKGVLFALNIDAIKPKEAATIRQLQNAPYPIVPASPKEPLMDVFFRGLEEASPNVSPNISIHKKLLERVRSISARHDYKETRFWQKIECSNSKEIYTFLLKSVNLKYYDPLVVGLLYRNLQSSCLDDYLKHLIKDTTKLIKNKRLDQVVQKIEEIMGDDPSSRDFVFEAILPFFKEIVKNEEGKKIIEKIEADLRSLKIISTN